MKIEPGYVWKDWTPTGKLKWEWKGFFGRELYQELEVEVRTGAGELVMTDTRWEKVPTDGTGGCIFSGPGLHR